MIRGRHNRGTVLIGVSAFVGLSLLTSLFIQRKIAMIVQVLRHEVRHETGLPSENVALARALEALQTGEAPYTPYQCKLQFVHGGSSAEFEVEYTKSGSQWTVAVSNQASLWPDCPTFF